MSQPLAGAARLTLVVNHVEPREAKNKRFGKSRISYFFPTNDKKGPVGLVLSVCDIITLKNMKIKKKKFIKSKSLSGSILESIYFFWEQARVKTPRGFGWIDIDSDYWLERNREIKAWYLKRELRRMQQRDLIRIKQKGSHILIKLSDDARLLVLQKRIFKTKKKLPDSKKCYIIFDVPETVRGVRKRIRDLLLRFECKKIQNSVWVTDYDIVNDFWELICLSGLDKWVKIIVGQEFKKRQTGSGRT